MQIERAKRVLEGYVSRTFILLDVARLTGDVFGLNREPVVVEELVSAITDLYAAKAESRGVRIDVDIAPGMVGHWDRAAVEAVLANLVFQRLKVWRGDSSRNLRSNVGYGLGLWIAQEFARLHGGSIMLEPTSGGSTFVVTLPIGHSTIAGSVA